jgi:hypothetical protein
MWEISWVAVIVSAVAGFAVGGLWYGPLFGKAWQAESGVTDEMANATNMPLVFGTVFVLNLFASFILGHVLATYGHPSLATSVMIAGGIALGFIVTSFGVNYLFARKSLKLFMIDGAYWTIVYCIMGAIFALL